MFDGKVALVTGGASGIGQALCRELSERGAKVIVVDRDAEGAARVASEIMALHRPAISLAVDVCSSEQVQQAVSRAVAEYGRLDYMFNNAGGGVVAAIHDMTLEGWKKTIDVNLMGVIYGTHFAYDVMRRQGGGHIINTASGGGLFAGPLRAAYCTAKFGVVGFTLAMRTESPAFGVKASVVCPGTVRTPIFQTMEMVGLDRDAIQENLRNRRMMSPEEAAKRILAGVERNKGIIVIDGLIRTLWWIFRLSPMLFERLITKIGASKQFYPKNGNAAGTP